MASWFGNSNANNGPPSYYPNPTLRAQQNASAMAAFINRFSTGVAAQMNHFVYGIDMEADGMIINLPILKGFTFPFSSYFNAP